MTSRRVLVTRPAKEAVRWIEALRARGFDAQPLPLIAIEAQADDSALHAARTRAGSYDALMFVSAAAVQHFFAGAAALSVPGIRFWATGPGTAAALQAAGVAASDIDVPTEEAGSFDSESLWSLVSKQVDASTRVLIVRGGDAQGRAQGREWLAGEIASAGGTHDTVVAYRRLVATWGESEMLVARGAAEDGSIWLLSSSQAVSNLEVLMPQVSWAGARAVATHPRIADAARRAGFGRVASADPGMDALVASIESFE